MKIFRFWFQVVAVLSLVNIQPASGISIWDVNDSDYGFTMKFSEQFVYGSAANESFSLPSAYWGGGLWLAWGGTGAEPNTTIVWGSVDAYHLAVGTGLGPSLDSNTTLPPPWNSPLYDYYVGPGNARTLFGVGHDGWFNSLGGFDVASGDGTLSYDAQSGIVSINGRIALSRTPIPAGNGVPDVTNTAWLAIMAFGTIGVAGKFFVHRQSV